MKKLKSTLIAVSVLFAGMSGMSGCGDDENPVVSKDIVETATDAGDFKTLIAALEAAGLDETLQGEGPFTVFAPNDAAFAKLPEGTVESLLQDIPALSNILTYHVVAGDFDSTEVVAAGTLKTVQGQDLTVKVENGKVFVNNSQVIQADIKASNGVIHVIDTVLLPQ